jgi:O-antigen chain-terminating methyltransferase
VDYFKIKGFNALNEDAIVYISSLSNESIGGIFAAQLIEHLRTDQIIQLCNDAYKKLKPDSYLILETPNPTSLAIYTNAFYVDPSHNKPVHPKTMEYFLRQAGFKDIQILYTEHSRSKYRLPLLNGENISNLNEFNDGINCITDILFGSQDYAIMAKK